MKATDLIKQLQKEVKKHGDLEVGYFVDEFCIYHSIGDVFTKEAERDSNPYDSDHKSLGDNFIALG